jgi:2-dehydro-3-deoxygluconokinase
MEVPKILTVGEPLAVLVERDYRRKARRRFFCHIAGAELNVAVNLALLDYPVTYATKIGMDSWGENILEYLAIHSVDDKHVLRGNKRTGLMTKSMTFNGGDPKIEYDRKGTSAATMSTKDVASIDLAQYRHLHMTGIFASLSPVTLETTYFLTEKAHANGASVSFDPNLRLQRETLRPLLWNSTKKMIQETNALAAKSDMFFPGIGEARILTGLQDKDAIVDYYLGLGAQSIFLKMGREGNFGAYVATARKRSMAYGFLPADTKPIDTVGAGDGFASGVIHGFLTGLSLNEAARIGCAVGEMQIMDERDNGAVGSRGNLDSFMRNPQGYIQKHSK